MYAQRKRLGPWLGLLLVLAVVGTAFAHDELVPRPATVAAGGPVPTDFDRLNYLFESFESAVPPTGWTLMTSGVSTTWEQTNAAAQSGNFSAAVFYGPQGAMQDEWLVTSAIDLSTAGGATLEFFENEAYWADYGLRHSIAVSTTVPDNPAAFTNVIVWTPANHTINGFGGDPVQLDLSAYAGFSTVYVAFRYEGDWADDWYIDDVRVFEPSAHDIAALEALPIGHVEGGTAITPQGVVKNVGLNAESFDVRYELFVEGVSVYEEIVAVANVAPNATRTVDFPTFVVEGGNYYQAQLTTLLAGDEDTSNDVAWGGFDSWLLTHTPMMFLFTNSGCSPCVQANEAMDAYMPTQGNAVALMRIHAWWPFAGDIMYTANVDQCTAYIDEYGVNGVPDFWLDGFLGLGYAGVDAVAAFEEAKLWASPMSVTPAFWNMATEQLTVEIQINSELPPGGDYRLVCCFTEDGIEHNGGNGEPLHNQAFLWAYPDMEGTPIGTMTGSYWYIIDMPLNPAGSTTIPWEYVNLRATCYVQDRGEAAFRKIYEAGTRFLTEIDDVTPVALSLFELNARPGAVDIRWESATEQADFRLLRVLDGAQVELPYTVGTGGSYTATDALAAGGEARYQLFGREAGEDWLLLRSENVTVEPAVIASRLERCWPNPFNPKTTIRYTLAAAGEVRVSVFDLQGRRVADLFQGAQTAGSHELSWDAGELGSGIYFVRLVGQNVRDSQKVVLTK